MADWIVVVDDDVTNLKMAGHILSKHNKRVTAMKSGRALLDFIRENVPDIILLDIKMPEMDGFETLEKLRALEKELQIDEIPVIFLTADDESSSEMRGFEMGVSDYVKKPFDPEILVRRIDNVLGKQEQILTFKGEAEIDKLTGFLNKAAVTEKMIKACTRVSGYFLMIDLDSFKLVNDIYGHDMGDKVLAAFSEILQSTMPEDSIIGRVGGDEFVAFSPDIQSETDISRTTVNLNVKMLERSKKLMGANMDVPLGVSVGAMYVSGVETKYEDVAKQADRALYKVKQRGKHGYCIYTYEEFESDDESHKVDIKTISMILGERNIADAALQLDMDAFIFVYRFVMRYIIRYQKEACKLLFTLAPFDGKGGDRFNENCDAFMTHIRAHLRKSDLVVQYKRNQIFILLTAIKEDNVSQVIANILHSWNVDHEGTLTIQCETEFIEPEDASGLEDEDDAVGLEDEDQPES